MLRYGVIVDDIKVDASQFSCISFRDVAIWCYCVDDIKVAAASQFSRISFRNCIQMCFETCPGILLPIINLDIHTH